LFPQRRLTRQLLGILRIEPDELYRGIFGFWCEWGEISALVLSKKEKYSCCSFFRLKEQKEKK
jgi:hypothetical protein